jgi:hypothetical protein
VPCFIDSIIWNADYGKEDCRSKVRKIRTTVLCVSWYLRLRVMTRRSVVIAYRPFKGTHFIHPWDIFGG